MWQKISQKQLTLDQTSTPLEVDRFEVEQFYDPLALELIKLSGNQNRALVAIAGPPGSGKTAFASVLTTVINIELKSEQAVLIQQDGWHYPNSYLDSHLIHHQGEDIPLRQLKGSPETYDTRAAYDFLKKIKQGQSLGYPVYSRQLHDPIPDAGIIRPDQHIIILEGNYWLLQEAAWQPFQALFDATIFLTALPEKLVDGLRQRHLRGGKTIEFTQKHMNKVDLPNIERVLNHSAEAQIVVHKKDSQHIGGISYHLSDTA
jgi:putative kinase